MPSDLTLDLCGDVRAGSGRVWTLTFDGAAGERRLLALIAGGRTPCAEIREGGVAIAAARFGADGDDVLGSFTGSLAGVVALVLAALRGGASVPPTLPNEEIPPNGAAQFRSRKLLALVGRQGAQAAARRLYRLFYRTPHWRVGWRNLDGPDLVERRRHPASGWRALEDDGRRFYADPFPILHQGQVTLFVEEYDHEIGKGVISAVPFTAAGPVGRPTVVLEQPGHLSYPFVFECDGQVWMIPESCSAGAVDLFRATAFPGGWVREATLIRDVAASDATLVEHDGRWWLFATVRKEGCSFSDTLCLWSAPDFRGPWTPHRRNPVLIDIASARPAGRMIHRGGALLRPVQDCRRGYGAALGIARVTRLDDDGFEQVVETILTPGVEWPGRRLHTLNSAGGLEFIDGSASSPRWSNRRRRPH